jgi:hypothetical protein
MSKPSMTVPEYARHLGVSHVAVYKAIKTGRLSRCLDGNRIIDVDLADQEWRANTDAAQQRKSVADGRPLVAPGEKKSTVKLAKKAAEPAPVADDEALTIPDGAPLPAITEEMTFAEARAIREAYNARLAKLEFEEKSGTLLPAETVRMTMFNISRKCRDMLMGLPDRIAPLVNGMDDQHEIHRLLTDEVRRACAEIAALKPPTP